MKPTAVLGIAFLAAGSCIVLPAPASAESGLWLHCTGSWTMNKDQDGVRVLMGTLNKIDQINFIDMSRETIQEYDRDDQKLREAARLTVSDDRIEWRDEGQQGATVIKFSYAIDRVTLVYRLNGRWWNNVDDSGGDMSGGGSCRKVPSPPMRQRQF